MCVKTHIAGIALVSFSFVQQLRSGECLTTAYKGLVRPVLEYGSSVWTLTHGLQEELEKVQNRAARFVTGNYVFETGTMTGILGQLKWESLKKRRKDSRLYIIYCYTKV